MTSPPGERITVGLVRGLHGLNGAIRIEVLSDLPGRFAPGSVLYADGDPRPLTVAWVQPSKPGLLLRFQGLTTREAVEPLRARYLEAIPEEPLPAGTWYWHQIEGLVVETTTGEQLGRVVEVFRAGEGEVYVVKGGPRGEILVPAVGSIVTEVAVAAGRLVVDPLVLGLEGEPPVGDPPRRSGRRVRGASDVDASDADASGPSDASDVDASDADASGPSDAPDVDASDADTSDIGPSHTDA